MNAPQLKNNVMFVNVYRIFRVNLVKLLEDNSEAISRTVSDNYTRNSRHIEIY